MTKEEFLKTWKEILEADCKRGMGQVASRTLMDSEAELIGKHLWEQLGEAKFDMLAEKLTQLLLETQGFISAQERAKRIVLLASKTNS